MTANDNRKIRAPGLAVTEIDAAVRRVLTTNHSILGTVSLRASALIVIQDGYKPTIARDRARKWWQDAVLKELRGA